MTTREQTQAGADSSVAQLVEPLSAQVSALVREEMTLATAEMKRKGAQAGVALSEQIVGRGNELKARIVSRSRELCGQAVERGNELRGQAVAAVEATRTAVSQAPTGRWMKLACVGLTLVVFAIIARRGRS